jgi:hypothetical protein
MCFLNHLFSHWSYFDKRLYGMSLLVAGNGKGTVGSYLLTASSTLRKARKKHPSPTNSVLSYDCGFLFGRVYGSNPTQVTDYPVSSRYLYQGSSQTMNTLGSAASIVGAYTGCPTTYQTRHFFNNSNTNDDIATKFEQEYVRCVRNVMTLYMRWKWQPFASRQD